MEKKEFFIEHDRIRLHAKLDLPQEEKEKYPLVIVVHGYTGHMEEPHILAITDALAENGYAVLRVEMYGHGQSDGTFHDHTVLKWVSELLTVIDYAAGLSFVQELYLTGHSQGGLAVMLAAALKRDVLKALIPLAPAIVIRDDARRGCSFGTSFDPEHVPDEVDMGEGRILSGNYFRTAQMLPIEEAIRFYRGPVQIIHSDTDETVPFFYAQEAADAYADAELVTINGDTHCFDDHIEEVTEAMVRFLNKIRRENGLLQ